MSEEPIIINEENADCLLKSIKESAKSNQNEITLGEYIRTKDGIIAKLEDIQENADLGKFYWFDRVIYCRYSEQIDFLTTEELPKYIVKHSKNITDLIQVGDYVNGHLVVEHVHEKGRLFVSCTYVGGIAFTTVEDYSWELTKNKEENIETIVTKQQFSNMEYRL